MPTRVLVLSDTHLPGRGRSLPPAVLEAAAQADLVVHAQPGRLGELGRVLRAAAEERQVLEEVGEQGDERDDQEADGSEQRRPALDPVGFHPVGFHPVGRHR